MKTISKSRLKAHMLAVFRDIERSAEDLIVTDRDRPVLRISRYAQTGPPEQIFAGLQGKVVYHEDINEPTQEEWDVK